MAEKLVFPIGHLKGAVHSEVGKPTGRYDVRIGWGIASLGPAEFLVWSAAHGSLPEINDQSWTKRDLLASLSSTPLADPEEAFHALVEAELLAEVDPRSPEAVEFAENHRVFPLMQGLGNTAEDPTMFQIGLPDAPAVSVGQSIYMLWLRSHLNESLFDGCQELAGLNISAGATNEIDTNAEQLLGAFLEGFHHLLVTSGAYLDVVPRGGEE